MMDERIEPKLMPGALGEEIVNRWLYIHQVDAEGVDAMLSYIRYLEIELYGAR